MALPALLVTTPPAVPLVPEVAEVLLVPEVPVPVVPEVLFVPETPETEVPFPPLEVPLLLPLLPVATAAPVVVV